MSKRILTAAALVLLALPHAAGQLGVVETVGNQARSAPEFITGEFSGPDSGGRLSSAQRSSRLGRRLRRSISKRRWLTRPNARCLPGPTWASEPASEQPYLAATQMPGVPGVTSQ